MKPLQRAGWLAVVLALCAAPVTAAVVREGDAMPSWALPDHTGKLVRSSDLAGRSYLLWFYPKARTPGCTAEGRGLREAHGELSKAGVVVLGVSFDDPEANAAFVQAESFPFRLLSDDGSLAVAVGAAEPGATVARRISYLVGPDGRVRRAYDPVEPAEHASQVLRDVAAEPGGSR